MSIWQTLSWQDMLIASGQSEEYFVIELSLPLKKGVPEERGGGIKIFVEKRKVSLGEYGLFVIGLSLPLKKGVPEERGGGIFESLQELCREEKCLFVQVETIDYNTPSVLRTPPSTKEALMSPSKRGREPVTESRGSGGYYKKFIPPYTVLIDLTQSEDEILAAMKPKGRYNIRLAEKKGVVVEQVDKNPYNAEIFYNLMQETTSRDDFAGNTLEYYKNFLEQIDESQLMFAYFEETVIAAGIFVYSGDVALYYYGASGNNHRNLMAPYLLQWTAITHAKKRGCKIYDFLGVAGDDETSSSLAGVTDFKMKLSPQKHLVSGSYIYVNKSIKYKIIMLLKKVMKK